jgi:ssDNA-specific exonuclease RecJ
MIVDINKINTDTEEGQLLLMSLAELSGIYTDKTPNDILESISLKHEHVFNGGENNDEIKKYFNVLKRFGKIMKLKNENKR